MSKGSNHYLVSKRHNDAKKLRRHCDIVLWIIAFKAWMGFFYILIPAIGALLSWLAVESVKNVAISELSDRLKPVLNRILDRAKTIKAKQKDKTYVQAAISSFKIEFMQALSILDKERSVIANTKGGKPIVAIVDKIKSGFNKIKNMKLGKRDSRATTGRTVTKAQMRIILGLPPNANVGQEWKGEKLSGIIIVINKNDPRQKYSMPERQVNELLLEQKISKGYQNPYVRLRGFDYGPNPVSLATERAINNHNKSTFTGALGSLSEIANALADVTNTLTNVKRGTKNAVMSAKLAASGIKQASGLLSSISRGVNAARREL